MNLDKVLVILNKKAQLISKMCPDYLPEVNACSDGHYFSEENLRNKKDFLHIMNWTTSFYTGIALLSYEDTANKDLLRFVTSKNDLYYKKVFEYSEDTMHDIGFLYSLQNVALYRLTRGLLSEKISLRAADVLAKRYLHNYGVFRAWGRMDDTLPQYVTDEESKSHFYTQSKGLAIIDCMMNLPLLYYAAEETRESYYEEIANSHADKTIKHFIREDGSLYHSFRFGNYGENSEGGCNYCGYSDESYWSRGVAWAIYGFAIAYSYTENERYLATAKKLADSFISQITLENPIPIWDFYLPEGEEKALDTAAAAIAANGFLLINKYTNDKKYLQYANAIAEVLSDKYLNKDEYVEGILREQNGNHTYTPYGDYFFFELIMNLKNRDRQLYW